MSIAHVWLLRELRQEIEWRENLEIPLRARFEVVGIRVGKRLTSLFRRASR